MNRIALFSFYDNQGIADDYVIFLLNQIKKYCSEIHCVVNGFLTDNANEKLNSICETILIRENKGFDAWGYKTLMEKLSYEKLACFDEVVCFNHTCFGPIDSFEPMFSKMENEECDFWGLYLSQAPKGEIYNPGEHIPSYFVVYRKSLVEKPDFKAFWDNLPELCDYNNAVKFYEQSQTPFFKERGFRVKTAFDFSKYQKESEWWFLEKQAEMLTEGKLPLLKRRPFFRTKYGINGEFYRTVITYIKEKTSYDINLICQNIERTQKISEIKSVDVFHLIWWHILAEFGNLKYKDRLKSIILKEELLKLFFN